MTNFESVKKFMETFGQEIKEKAAFPNNKITSLRYDLIKEELEELKEAIENRDIKEVADAGADTFVSGSAIFNQPDYFQIIKEMRDSLETCLLYTSPSPRD